MKSINLLSCNEIYQPAILQSPLQECTIIKRRKGFPLNSNPSSSPNPKVNSRVTPNTIRNAYLIYSSKVNSQLKSSKNSTFVQLFASSQLKSSKDSTFDQLFAPSICLAVPLVSIVQPSSTLTKSRTL